MSDSEPLGGGLLGQREALVEVARALWDELPDEFESITCVAMVMGDFGEYQQTVSGDAGEQPIGASYPLVKATTRLREIMYQPDSGTWYTATFRLVRPGKLESHFDYDNEPAWSMEPADESYRVDASKFPRLPEHTPEWLRAKLES